MHHTTFQRLWLLLAIAGAACLTACDTSTTQSNLPQARGASGEIILVMDSAAWENELGDELRQTFMEAMPGLPQGEPYFDLRYVSPFKLNSVLRSAKNMIFVTTLDNQNPGGKRMQRFFTKNSLDRIQQEPGLYMFARQDEYARGQEVLHLFGKTQSDLVNNLRENRKKIRQQFEETMLERITQNIYKSNEQRPVSEHLLKEHGFSIRIPYGYEQVPLNDSVKNFVWLRQLDEVDKSIVITYKDYTSEEAFSPDNILAFRHQQLGRYIVADGPSTYMTLQDSSLVEFDTVTFEGKFAVEARGLWRMNNVYMGGGFLSYTFVDEAQDRLYYIEGFLYSPSKKKRPSIRELEAILRTFRTVEESKKPVAAK